MNRGEPTLAPEWLKGSGFSSSHSDEHSSATLLRNRLVVSAVDHDAPREASSSFRRSSSSNGYINFGSRHRDRDRYNDRDRRRDREKDNFLDNDSSDFLTRKRNERDTLRRSHSMVSGRRVDALPKRLGSDLKDRGSDKVSFDNRDFPSLGTEEKQGVSSFMSSGFKKLNINTDGWTSALAEVPTSVHTNSNVSSSTVSGNATSLSMAEALVQAPPKAHTAPPMSNETERRKELALMYNKLIPVTPQGPKNLVEKSKLKGNRNGDIVTPKPIHPPITNSDALKTNPQPSKLIVLNRDVHHHNNNNNITSATAKDVKVEKKANGGVTEKKPLVSTAPSINANPKPKANGMSRDRNNFFNSLREKAGNNKNGEQSSSLEHNMSSATNNTATENSLSIETKVEELVLFVAPNEEEKAFLVSLGWNEDANDDALTTEEIQSWIKKNEKKLAPNFKARLIGTC